VRRAKTVELNEQTSRGDARAALALLEKSMNHGHERIGLLRYLMARRLGASLEPRHHTYAEQITAKMSASALVSLLEEAQRRCRN